MTKETYDALLTLYNVLNAWRDEVRDKFSVENCELYKEARKKTDFIAENKYTNTVTRDWLISIGGEMLPDGSIRFNNADAGTQVYVSVISGYPILTIKDHNNRSCNLYDFYSNQSKSQLLKFLKSLGMA